MQKHITGLLIIVLLSACTPPRQASDDNFMQKRIAEEASWARLNELSVVKCDVSPLTPERDRAVEISNCVTQLVNQYVLPNAVFPDLLLSSRAEALRIAQDYADGKISAAEYKRRSEDRLKNYSRALIYFANQQAPSGIG